jgi:guanylate kinase
MARGTLYIISAPSGCGKTSLVNAILASIPQICVSVSYTTRPPRPNETGGLHYHFVTLEEFKTLIEQNAFLEYAQVFGNYYGTPITWVKEKLEQGLDVILEIDWQGAKQIKHILPEATSIFLLPPSCEALYDRLKKRGQDSEAIIHNRMHQAQLEISHYKDYDYVVVNTEFEKALNDFKAIIQAKRLRTTHQISGLNHLIKTLI